MKGHSEVVALPFSFRYRIFRLLFPRVPVRPWYSPLQGEQGPSLSQIPCSIWHVKQQIPLRHTHSWIGRPVQTHTKIN